MSIRRYHAPAALIVLCLIWGYNWVMMKEGLRFAAPFDFVALRALCGALVLFAVMAARQQSLMPQAPLACLVFGLLQTTGFLGLATWALVEGGAGKTAVLVYAMPFWTLLLAWPLLGDRLSRRQWAAVLLALPGIFLILEPWNLHTPLKSKLLAIGAGISGAASTIFVKWLRTRHTIDLLSLTAWQMLFGGLALGVIALWVPGQSIMWSPYFIWVMFFNIVLGTALAWLLWLYALNQLSASTASLSLLMVPVVGVTCAQLQLGEVPGAIEFTGMLLIGAAIVTLISGATRNAASGRA